MLTSRFFAEFDGEPETVETPAKSDARLVFELSKELREKVTKINSRSFAFRMETIV